MENHKTNELLISFHSHFGSKTIEKLILEIEQKKPKIVIYWSVQEWMLPGNVPIEDIIRLKYLIIEQNVFLYILLGSYKNYENCLYTKILPETHFKTLHWPTYYLHMLNVKDTKEKINFEFLYSCLNNVAHYHRSLFIDHLYKNSLFEFGRISWNQLNLKFLPDEYEFKYWEQKIITLDGINYFRDNFTTKFYQNDKSFISVITESTTKSIFFTEKTYKPIVSFRPFIILGSKNQNKEIKNLGFNTFDNIFDYSFDESDDVNMRVNGIIENLIRLKNKNYNELFNTIYETLKHNKKNAIEIIEKDPYIPKEIQFLKENYKDVFTKNVGNKIGKYFTKFI